MTFTEEYMERRNYIKKKEVVGVDYVGWCGRVLLVLMFLINSTQFLRVTLAPVSAGLRTVAVLYSEFSCVNPLMLSH